MDDEYVLSEEAQINVLTNQLSEAILSSDEYRNYHRVEAEIRMQPELYAKVNELRRHNFSMQTGFGRMTNDEYLGLSSFSQNMHENPLVNEFLNAEVALARLIQDIMRKLVSNIEFDTDFL